MKLVLDGNIAQQYPDLRIGTLTARGITNVGCDERLNELKLTRARDLRQRALSEELWQHPHIVAWQDTFRSFGVNPKKKRPTAESLLRRLVMGGEIPSISKVVDTYLLAEVDSFLPVGGYDLDRLRGNIHLRRSAGGEPFVPLGAPTATEYTQPMEIVYADANQVLTRRWNHKDCDHCKITERSRNIVLFSEAAVSLIHTEALEILLAGLAENLAAFCGGLMHTRILCTADALEFELE